MRHQLSTRRKKDSVDHFAIEPVRVVFGTKIKKG